MSFYVRFKNGDIATMSRIIHSVTSHEKKVTLFDQASNPVYYFKEDDVYGYGFEEDMFDKKRGAHKKYLWSEEKGTYTVDA
jgi:hypothetical protein